MVVVAVFGIVARCHRHLAATARATRARSEAAPGALEHAKASRNGRARRWGIGRRRGYRSGAATGERAGRADRDDVTRRARRGRDDRRAAPLSRRAGGARRHPVVSSERPQRTVRVHARLRRRECRGRGRPHRPRHVCRRRGGHRPVGAVMPTRAGGAAPRPARAAGRGPRPYMRARGFTLVNSSLARDPRWRWRRGCVGRAIKR